MQDRSSGPRSGFEAVAPARVLDTRGAAKLGAGRSLPVALSGVVPRDAVAAVVSVTAVGPCDAGYLVVHACGEVPDTTTIALSPHDTATGFAIVPLDSDKRRQLYSQHPELEVFEAQASLQRFPVLAQRPNGDCVFLDAQRRCSIHDVRPASCRRYPALLGDDLVSLRWATFCRSIRHDPEAHLELLSAAVSHHNQKLDDLWLLEVAWAELERLGLTVYLPEEARRRRRQRFDAALARQRGEGDRPDES